MSGYEDRGHESPDLHAWAEVYIPGGGWRGFDPSRGLAVGETYVAAAAAQAPGAAPVEGTFRGADVTTQFHAEIQLDRVRAALAV